MLSMHNCVFDFVAPERTAGIKIRTNENAYVAYPLNVRNLQKHKISIKTYKAGT